MLTRLQAMATFLGYSTPADSSRTGGGARSGSQAFRAYYGSVDPVNDFFRASMLLTSPFATVEAVASPFQQLMQTLQMPQETACVGPASGNGVVGGWPLRGRITSSFGHRDVPGIPSNHTGIDFGVPEGTPVAATGDGVVKTAGWEGGYGLVVRIEHDGGMQTVYGHNSRLAVSPGDHVSQGQVISYSGNTGLSTGPHLHYEVRVDGRPVDPAPYLDSAPGGGSTSWAAGSGSASSSLVPESAIARIIESAARRHGVDAGLVSAVVKAESGFNPRAVSPAGAKGLMQLMKGTADSLGVTDPFDPAQNVDGGVRYLRRMLDRYGDVSLALAAYNAGPNAVDRYGGVPPFNETQRYVSRVLDYWREQDGPARA